MKIRKLLVICLSALLFATAACNAPSRGKTENSGTSSAPASLSSISQSSTSTAASSEQSVSSEPVSSKQVSSEKSLLENTSSTPGGNSKKEQGDSDWVAYDTNKDDYKLHIRKKDGTKDKVIVNDAVLAPCVAGEWVYYIAPLREIEKVKLDGSQKTKVCSIDAFQVYNVNLNTYHGLNGSTSITAKYLDGYILYTCFQLHEFGDKPNPPSYYKLNLKQNKIIPVGKS